MVAVCSVSLSLPSTASSASPCWAGGGGGGGRESWNKDALPHARTFQAGASRSVAPVRLTRRVRLWDASVRGSARGWRSRKRVRGRVRWAFRVQVCFRCWC